MNGQLFPPSVGLPALPSLQRGLGAWCLRPGLHGGDEASSTPQHAVQDQEEESKEPPQDKSSYRSRQASPRHQLLAGWLKRTSEAGRAGHQGQLAAQDAFRASALPFMGPPPSSAEGPPTALGRPGVRAEEGHTQPVPPIQPRFPLVRVSLGELRAGSRGRNARGSLLCKHQRGHTFIAFTSVLFWFIQTFVKPPGKLPQTVYVHSSFARVYFTSGYKGLPPHRVRESRAVTVTTEQPKTKTVKQKHDFLKMIN